MYILKTEASFDSAHFLAGYNGKCSNLHGHRWKIVLEVQAEELKDDIQHKGNHIIWHNIQCLAFPQEMEYEASKYCHL